MKISSIKLSTSSLIFILSLVYFCSTFVTTAFAAEDSDFVQVARERHYVGGLEESDLKVQQKLLTVDEVGRATGNETGNEVNRDESEEGF